MAKGLGRGINSLTVWMVLFVGLWLASTVLLVILYTGQELLVKENDRLAQDNARLISRGERNSVTLFQSARPSEGQTVVGLLERARAELAELATGESSDHTAEVRTKLDEFLRIVRADRSLPSASDFQDISFLQALTMLYETFNTQASAQADLEARATVLEGEVAKLSEASAQQQEDFDRGARELSDQLAEVETDRDRYRTERDKQIEDMEHVYDERRLQADADLTKERQRVADLEEHLSRLHARVLAFQEKFGDLMVGPEELATAREPDGYVLTAVPGDNVVYINLGRRNRLVLGMRFAVYAPDGGIPASGRAKAQIEVVSADESSAECEIVRVNGPNLIMEGDLIANPVYDPSRPVRFVIVGDFDLDHDGRPDLGGVGAIQSMVRQWGGTISEELTALTDFVVIGGAPRRPRAKAEASSDEAARIAALQRRYDRYNEVVTLARTLAVPILTQQVFLNFLGYAYR